jgi:DNA processing protein
MVGSRTFTEYGKKMAHAVATGLARQGVTVVSGLARGIDGIAHQAALEAGGRTLAVMANGLGRVYPAEHTDLARRIESAGAVLSENPMDEPPSKTLFPGRNRIISGLSQIVVIIEAAARSGTLITAEHAAEQGRTVMAIPGPAGSNTSEGTNNLIRQGAILCRGVDDVLEELMGVSAFMQHKPPAPPPASPPPPALDPTQQRIWEYLRDGARSLDQLVQQLGLPVPQMSATLMMLEMKKVVRRLPGNRYERA